MGRKEYSTINNNNKIIIPDNNKNISQPQTKEDHQKNISIKQKIIPTPTQNQNQKPPMIYPHLFPPVLLPLNNMQKIQPQINPTIMMQMTKMNPYHYLHTLAIRQYP